MIRRLLLISAALYLLISASIAFVVYQSSLRDNLNRLAHSGGIRVEQTEKRLTDQLDRFRVLTNVLARDPRIANAMLIGADRRAISDFLRQHVLTYGAARIELVDITGRVVASSQPDTIDADRATSALFNAAIFGSLGRAHGLEDGRRRFQFSKGVLRGQAIGAVLVSAEIDAIEFEWNIAPETISFFDHDGVVFVSNRPSLLLLGGGSGASFPVLNKREIGGHAIWDLSTDYGLPPEALIITRQAPLVGMTARGFLDTRPARAAARLRTLLSLAFLTLIGLAALIVAQWRRRLSERLAIEAQANEKLEARVEERTAALHAAQHQLVQASKLTALGQMSAGISHELNQPLAAIMNFAENGGRFLALGKDDGARQNFEHISDQVHRIDRIIRNLRAFARNEDEPMEPVSLVAAVAEALSLVETNARKQGIVIHYAEPEASINIIGGKVRLQQVVVNLLTNAMDAMAESPDRQIWVDLTAGESAQLTVRDAGPGIADPSRVFEPFYSTKELGASKGLGLGLSISYGIIGSFGGKIVAENHPAGGALFRIELPLAKG